MSENKNETPNWLVDLKRAEKEKLDKREILNELFFIRRQIDTLIEAVYELGITDGPNKDYDEASARLINSIEKDEKLPERVDAIERKEFIPTEEELNNFTFGFDTDDSEKKEEKEISEKDKEWFKALDEDFPFEPPKNYDAPTDEDLEALRKEWENLPLPDDEQEKNNE